MDYLNATDPNLVSTKLFSILSWFFSIIVTEPFYDDFHFKNYRTFQSYS